MNLTPIMERLKSETWPLHQSAEKAPLEQDLVKGNLPRHVYREYLAQRYLLHQAFEERLRQARESDPRIAAVAENDRFHQERAGADLEFFGGNRSRAAAVPATQALLSSIQQAPPFALLGVLYVFEGSTNGARFIARALRKAWGLTADEGTRYLDPYGETQREKWAAFKTAMNEQPFTEAEQEQIVAAAKATFLQIIDVSKDLYPASV